jgi:predicted Zn finger-like uncharacterized protein
MPEVITCPHCDQKARVPEELLGKKVKCPNCKKTFMAGPAKPAAPPPPPREEEVDTDIEVVDKPEKRRGRRDDDEEEDDFRPQRRSRRDEDDEDEDRPRRRSRRDEDDEDDRPRRRSRRDEEDEDEDDRPRRPARVKADWPKVHRGLSLILWGTLVPLIGMILWIPCGILATLGREVGLLVLMLVYAVAYLASLVMTIVGLFFCLPSPQNHGAKVLALVTLILVGTSGASILLGCVINIMQVGMAGSMWFGYGGYGGGGLGMMFLLFWLPLLGATFTFLFYLRALAQALKNDMLARSVLIYAIVLGSYILFSGFGWALLFALAILVSGGTVFFVLIILYLVVWLSLMIWFLVLLGQTRTTVGQYIEGPRR